MLSYLDQDITYLKGVGPHRAQLFQSQLGITTVRDLLHTASRAHRYDTKSG